MSFFYLPIIFSQTIFEAPDANPEKYIISLESIAYDNMYDVKFVSPAWLI